MIVNITSHHKQTYYIFTFSKSFEWGRKMVVCETTVYKYLRLNLSWDLLES